MKALKGQMQEMKHDSQIYYKKRIINNETERLNSILICGNPHC